jgi:hypothetical protein
MNLDLRLYQLIEEEYGHLLEKLAAELINGRASDYADYRYRVGRMHGVREALEIAKLANRKAIGLDDKEER